MAIKPDDAAIISDTEHRQQYDEAIANIDARLAHDWFTGREHITVHPPKMHEKVRERVLAEYKAAGWQIKTRSDQRDGTSWTFSKA